MADATGRSPKATRELLSTERTPESSRGLDKETASRFARRIEVHLWHGNFQMAHKVVDMVEQLAEESNSATPLEEWNLQDAGCEPNLAGILDGQGFHVVKDVLYLSYSDVCKLPMVGSGRQSVYLWGFIEDVRQAIEERDAEMDQ